MLESKFNGSADSELGYGQLFAVLMRRRILLIGVILGAIAVSAFLSARKEATYRSSMQLLVESNYGRNPEVLRDVAQRNQAFETLTEVDYATQIRLMRSPVLVARAVDQLRAEYSDISTQEIQAGLGVSRVTETEDEIQTKILQVDYTSNDPEKTQRVLEVMSSVYLDYNLEQQELRLSNGLAFIDEQLPTVRAEVAQAEQSLRQFREQQSVVDPEQQAAEVTQALNTIMGERRALRADFEDTQDRFNNLQSQLARSPEGALIASRLSQSQRFQALLNSLQETELLLAEQRVTFTDQAPPVQGLLEQTNNQRQLIQQEAVRVLGETTQADLSEDGIVRMAQLSQIDLNLIGQLVDTQTILVGLRARDQSLAQAEAQLRTELNQFPQLITEYNRLQPDITTQRETLQQLLAARQEIGLEIAQGGYNWQIVEPSDIGRRIGPNLEVDLILGAVVGIFLGVVLAFLREDDVLHSPDRIQETVALPMLGTVPNLPSSITGASRFNFGAGQATAPILQAANWPLFRESLDLIYKSIQRADIGSNLKSIAITSATAGEGKTTLALGLALSASRLHKRVLLIDANLRSPSLHRQLNLPNEQGLSTILTGDQTEASINRLNSNTDVLTAGPTSRDPVKLLSSQQMKDWMSLFEKDYDLVILDTSPVIGIVDAIETASSCDGIVMVARVDQVSQSDLIQAVTMLGEMNTIGIVANGAKDLKVQSITPYVQSTDDTFIELEPLTSNNNHEEVRQFNKTNSP
jgi:succinoglycan biosynthesis transport protein ExoP